MKGLEFKTFDFEIKEADESEKEGKLIGYASTFGNLDLGFDIVEKGAFKKTLKDSKGKIPILADHSPYDQIGWNERATEDEKGLLVEGSIDLNVQKGREKFSLAKKALEIGAKMGLSIGYATIKAEPDSQNPRVRKLKELKLYEYSLVTFPMNISAMVTDAKGLGGLDRARFFISQLKREGLNLKEIELALAEQAADEGDPSLSQSLDKLLKALKA